MERMKKTGYGMIAFLMAAILSFGLGTPVQAAGEASPKIMTQAVSGTYEGDVVILHSNDVHGAIDGYSKIAKLKTDYEEMGAEVLLVDAGDFLQGDPYVNTSSGLDAVKLMNAVDYAFAVPGNHEIDYGVDILRSNLSPENADFKTLCANLFVNDEQAFVSNAIYHAKNGIDIGLFGLATPETKTKANPVLTKDITIYSSKKMADCASAQAAELKQNGAECVIALAHLGVDVESGINENRSVDLFHNSEGIDFILDGHSHTVMTEGDGGEPIQSTGTRFAYIGVLVVNEQGEVKDHYLIDTADLPLQEEGEVATLTKEIKEKVDAEYSKVIVQSEVELDGSKAGNRSRETNNGDLTTDSLLWYAAQNREILDGFEGPVIAILNGGSIRDKIPKGDVTKKDIFTVHPFGNTLNIVYVKGSELLEALEASTFLTPELIGGYPQTAGIQFTIDTTKEYDAGEAYPDSTYHKPNSIQRVSIQSVNGKLFDPNATIAVVTNNFMANGGDTYYVFGKGKSVETGVYLDDNLVNYIKQELNGIITEAKYGKPRGDQTQILPPDPEPEPKPEPAPAPAPSKAQNALLAAITAKGKRSLVIRWEKTDGASGYEICLAKCGSKVKKVKTIRGNKVVSWTKSGLKAGTVYKARVKAYELENGKKRYLKSSPVVYAFTGGGNKVYTNARSVTVNKTKLLLKKGTVYKLKTKVNKRNKKKKLIPKGYVPLLRFLSSNKKIAAVTSTGKVKGIGKGSCYVYVYAHNGVFKKVKVTVR